MHRGFGVIPTNFEGGATVRLTPGSGCLEFFFDCDLVVCAKLLPPATI
jgi:hypothetical protein